jgi:NADPH2:quinone reductase
MDASIPESMRAAAMNCFGGPEVLQVRSLAVPVPKADEVLIRLESAGIGAWDPDVREGKIALGSPEAFPRVIGNDGAGVVVAVGEEARRFRRGEPVYAFAYEGGFYAEYVAVKEDDVAPIPNSLSPREAGALGADGITALRGLDDTLHLQPDENLLIFGASGGIGHIALQLAKRMGARVLAIASGPDGVDLVRRLGADRAVDGHRDDVGAAAAAFAPNGLDAALVLVSGQGLTAGLNRMKAGGRVAFPNGVEPAPNVRDGVRLLPYDGTPGRDAFERLNRLIGDEPFHIELARRYLLEDAATAHAHIHDHHLGKLTFAIRV